MSPAILQEVRHQPHLNALDEVVVKVRPPDPADHSEQLPRPNPSPDTIDFLRRIAKTTNDETLRSRFLQLAKSMSTDYSIG